MIQAARALRRPSPRASADGKILLSIWMYCRSGIRGQRTSSTVGDERLRVFSAAGDEKEE